MYADDIEDSITWRGRPLETFDPVVQCIGHTRTRRRGAVQAVLDERTYQKVARWTTRPSTCSI